MSLRTWILAKPNRMRHVMNIWPPFLFAGVKLVHISSDWRVCKVILKDRPWTKNANGTQFGGSMFAMTDPIYSVLLMGALKDRYFVWDKAASIEFIKPGIGEIYVECRITDQLMTEIQHHTRNGDKYFPEVVDIIYDSLGNEVAKLHRTLYVRLKPKNRPDVVD